MDGLGFVFIFFLQHSLPHAKSSVWVFFRKYVPPSVEYVCAKALTVLERWVLWLREVRTP